MDSNRRGEILLQTLPKLKAAVRTLLRKVGRGDYDDTVSRVTVHYLELLKDAPDMAPAHAWNRFSGRILAKAFKEPGAPCGRGSMLECVWGDDFDRILKVFKALRQCWETLLRPPTIREVCQAAGMYRKTVEPCLEALERRGAIRTFENSWVPLSIEDKAVKLYQYWKELFDNGGRAMGGG